METLDNGMLSISFSITKNNYTYSDAIVGNADYINALTPDEIEAIKNSVLTNGIPLLLHQMMKFLLSL